MNPLSGYYTAFFLGSFVRRMLAYACVVYGFEVLGSGDWSGLFYLALLFPYVLFSLKTGRLIDAGSKRTLLQVTSASAAVLLALLFVAEWRGWFASDVGHGGWIAALLFCYGSAYAVAYPTYIAAVPELAPPERVARTTVMINLLATVSMAYAPLAIGLLREGLRWPAIFGVLTLLSGASWLALQRVRFPDTRKFRTATVCESSVAELLRHCAKHPRLPTLLWLIVVFNALAVGPLEVLLPQYAEMHLRLTPFAAGAFIATGGTGLVVGAMAALRVVRQPRLGAWLCGFGIAGTLLIVAMSYVPAGGAFALLFIGGMMGGAFSSICLAAAQANAAEPMRGGVISLVSLAMGGVPAIGGLAAGLLSAQVGVAFTLRLCFTVAAVLFAGTFVMSSRLRETAGIPRM